MTWIVGQGSMPAAAPSIGGGTVTHGIDIYNNTSLVGNRIASGSLTIINGNYDASPGENISGLWIKGQLVTADNIHAEDCIIEFGVNHYAGGGVNIVVEYCDIGQTYDTPVISNLQYGGATLRYCHIFGGSDILTLNGDATHPTLIEYCYVHGVRYGPGDHNDLAQMTNGSDTTIRGCWFDREDVLDQTSVFIIAADAGNISNVLIEDNLLTSTGTGKPQCLIWGADGFTASGLTLNNNYVHEYEFGVVSNTDGTPFTESGNLWWPSLDPMTFLVGGREAP